jgi:orotidine-5'-phosphate decarboxylase
LTVQPSLCVALDGSDRDWILTTARNVADHVGWLKIGLEAFTAFGPALVHEAAELGPRIFLDLKLHDIPATVERAAANCAASGASMFNVHAAGGRAMLEAAVRGARSLPGCDPPLVIAVTVLTSLDDEVLSDLDIPRRAVDLVSSWARLARQCGLDGIVASAQEARVVRELCGEDFLIVSPGIRPLANSHDDQRRVVSPIEAIEAGADVLVVGRPITRAEDQAGAARSVVEEIASVGADQL